MRTFRYSLLMSLIVIAANAHAAEVRFNGFLTAAGGVLRSDSEDNMQFLDYTDDADFDSETKFALQAVADINEQMSVTGQVIARGFLDYDAEIDWAYVTYRLSDQWIVRGGRLRAPFYLYSDFLDVGFTYPWIRPPIEVYNIAFSNVTGIDTVYTTTWGTWDASFQAYYGGYDDDVRDYTSLSDAEIPTKLTNFGGVALTLTREWLTLRASVHHADVTRKSPTLLPLITGLRTAGFDSQADELELKDDPADFAEIGAIVDYDDWLLVGEYTKLRFGDSLGQDPTQWYALAGYRIGEAMVHLTYATLDTDLDNTASYTAGIPVVPQTAALRAGIVASVVSQERDQHSWTLGLRYNINESADIKFEYTDVTLERGETGQLTPGRFNVYNRALPFDDSPSLFRIAVDVVF